MTLQRRGRNSKRNSTACEHCRAARIRCQPSEQPGVCEKCLAFKRECISRTRPRPRRWERKWGTGNIESSAHSPGQITTFSLDFPVPARADLDEGFKMLRRLHDQVLDDVLMGENVFDSSQRQTQLTSLPSSSTSLNQSTPMSDIWRQPLFNMDSAEALLKAFKSMANYLPFITLPRDASVSHLATTNPFTLLAILTVTSGSRMVQNHSLYNDEFLKALSLKFVSGGERSLQLLQGVLIYCAWYPFHLRPKSGQLVHCLRMAEEIVHDLSLDEDFLVMQFSWGQEVTDEELDQLRAYLAFVYLISTYVVVWKGEKCLPTKFPDWTSAVIGTLQHNARTDGDNTLVALARLSILFSDATDAINETGSLNGRLTSIGLEYHKLRDSITISHMGSEVIQLQTMFMDVFLDCGSLLTFPVSKTHLSSRVIQCPPPVSKICGATKKLRILLDYVGTLDDSSLLSFTINDWTRLIVMLTLSFRLSFPLSLLPDFDSAWARSEIQLDQFLAKASTGMNTPKTSNDILSADRAVLGILKSKYDHRLDSLGDLPSAAVASRTLGCPMMNGSMEQWDPSLVGSSHLAVDAGGSNGFFVFHDIWATMTMGWGNLSDTDLDIFDESL